MNVGAALCRSVRWPTSLVAHRPRRRRRAQRAALRAFDGAGGGRHVARVSRVHRAAVDVRRGVKRRETSGVTPGPVRGSWRRRRSPTAAAWRRDRRPRSGGSEAGRARQANRRGRSSGTTAGGPHGDRTTTGGPQLIGTKRSGAIDSDRSSSGFGAAHTGGAGSSTRVARLGSGQPSAEEAMTRADGTVARANGRAGPGGRCCRRRASSCSQPGSVSERTAGAVDTGGAPDSTRARSAPERPRAARRRAARRFDPSTRRFFSRSTAGRHGR